MYRYTYMYTYVRQYVGSSMLWEQRMVCNKNSKQYLIFEIIKEIRNGWITGWLQSIISDVE